MTDPAEVYRALWSEIESCRSCERDPAIGPVLAKEICFRPLPSLGVLPPNSPGEVRWLVVAQEPSPGSRKWTSREAIDKAIKDGWRNFNNYQGDWALQYAIEKWLLRPGERYVITDLAKCMVSGPVAEETRWERYGTCSVHLRREVAMFPLHGVIAIGDLAHQTLRLLRAPSWPPIHGLRHYSGNSVAYLKPDRKCTKAWRQSERVLFEQFIERRAPASHDLTQRGLKVNGDAYLRLLWNYKGNLEKIVPSATGP